ncbi:DUF5372 family protein [Pararhizobium sp. LjRoot238]|uniref:DUF5372 family protein n=1 Tax=Pararhizobium sp. LjRoot238 TaxID=3342293 RepID=UPI003F4FF920
MSHVTITNPRHGLYGQRFELVSLETTRGRDFIVVKLRNGRHRSIRRNQTDLSVPLVEARERSISIPRIDVATLLTLMRHLRRTLALSTPEVIRDDTTAVENVLCSVPSTPAAVQHEEFAAALAKPFGGKKGADRQGDCRAFMAEAAGEQTGGDEPSC